MLPTRRGTLSASYLNILEQNANSKVTPADKYQLQVIAMRNPNTRMMQRHVFAGVPVLLFAERTLAGYLDTEPT